jgi:antitoxin MazE
MIHVKKWGNSLGVRIPKNMAFKVGIEEGSEIDMEVVDGAIIIKKRAESLEELLSQITPTNKHNDIDFGEAEGEETW